jgi:hypothetical protein
MALLENAELPGELPEHNLANDIIEIEEHNDLGGLRSDPNGIRIAETSFRKSPGATRPCDGFRSDSRRFGPVGSCRAEPRRTGVNLVKVGRRGKLVAKKRECGSRRLHPPARGICRIRDADKLTQYSAGRRFREELIHANLVTRSGSSGVAASARSRIPSPTG